MKNITTIQKVVTWLQGQGVTFLNSMFLIAVLGLGLMFYNFTTEYNKKFDEFIKATDQSIEIIKESQQEQVNSLVDLNRMLISDKIEMMRLEFADCETLDDVRERIGYWLDNKWTAQIASAKLVCTYAQDELRSALFPPETGDIICKAVR